MLFFVAGWGLLVLVSSPLAFIPIFVIVRLLEWSGVPRFINATAGGLFGGLISSYFILGMGWYIALAGPPLIIAGSLGALYGSWILPSRNTTTASASPLSYWRLSTAIVVAIGLVYLLVPDLFHSLVFGRHGSYKIDGLITKSGIAVGGLRVRNFNHADSCIGKFSEAVTNADGAYSFRLEYNSSDEFPKEGPCAYRVTLCYLGDNEWHKFWSGGHSGPCGGQAHDKLEHDLSRPGDYKVQSRF
jgi:hypothetical protein